MGELVDPAPPEERRFRCERPSRSHFHLLADGTLVPMRCGASNRCAYCAWLISVENAIVAGLDARWEQPTVGITLTTHRPDFDLTRFREAVAVLFRWLRCTLGAEVQYCGLMEWTTGKSGRGRMPHMHALVKGLDPAACESLHPLIREKWRGLTGGAWVVECRPLRTPGGAIAYMVGHHHKREQAPPRGLRGMKRMRPSRGYFHPRLAEARSALSGEAVSPIQAYRHQARQVMRDATAEKVALAKLIEADPPPDVRDQVLEGLIEQVRDAPPPVPVKVLRDGRLQHLQTGQVHDGPAAAIFAQATASARGVAADGSAPA